MTKPYPLPPPGHETPYYVADDYRLQGTSATRRPLHSSGLVLVEPVKKEFADDGEEDDIPRHPHDRAADLLIGEGLDVAQSSAPA